MYTRALVVAAALTSLTANAQVLGPKENLDFQMKLWGKHLPRFEFSDPKTKEQVVNLSLKCPGGKRIIPIINVLIAELEVFNAGTKATSPSAGVIAERRGDETRISYYLPKTAKFPAETKLAYTINQWNEVTPASGSFQSIM